MAAVHQGQRLEEPLLVSGLEVSDKAIQSAFTKPPFPKSIVVTHGHPAVAPLPELLCESARIVICSIQIPRSLQIKKSKEGVRDMEGQKSLRGSKQS